MGSLPPEGLRFRTHLRVYTIYFICQYTGKYFLTLGKRLVLLRDRANIRQRTVARRAKISLRLLRELEHDRAQFPSIWIGWRLAKAFRISIDELLSGVDEPEKARGNYPRRDVPELVVIEPAVPRAPVRRIHVGDGKLW